MRGLRISLPLTGNAACRFVLPAALLPIAQALYCLHRGPMLHWALPGHPEERALLQVRARGRLGVLAWLSSHMWGLPAVIS